MEEEKNLFERFSSNAKKSLIAAQDIAIEIGSEKIGTEHILLGIVTVKKSVGASLLSNYNVTAEKIRIILALNNPKTVKTSAEIKAKGLSAVAKKVVEESFLMAREAGSNYIGTEHLLHSLLSQRNSKALEILKKLKTDFKGIRDELDGYMQGPNFFYPHEMMPDFVDSETGQRKGKKTSKTPTLDEFCINLNEKAAKKELDPVIGREKEIERVVSILNRRMKNNPVLIGEPGVGKTAIVEGLAQRIVTEEVPEMLLNKKILILDMPGVIAGTKYRGEFEERMKRIIDEAKENKDIILFIDEVHNIVGAGAAEGAIDAANIFKPSLSRGDLQVIGATTLNEYRKYIEKDSALERRFQPVKVEEPSVEETLLILKGLRKKYEAHHKVKISDGALVAASKLAKRYIADRFLPDKAIDLIDEASSLIRVKSGSVSKVLRNLNLDLKKTISDKEDSVLSQNFAHAAKMKQKEDLIKIKMAEIKKNEGAVDTDHLVIDAENIAEVISIMTGVPVTRLIEKETDSLRNLEDTLRKRIVGQDEALNSIASAIRRSRTGIADTKRPIGSFIFLGPTGVGKTALAKVLAKEMFISEGALVKVDMSEFMEKHNVSRLVGAPAGYVGYEDAGQLTETIRRKPYSVVLFDEIEKAHPDFFNMLLQILEDGYLTDAKGLKVDFRNTIIIMTSNVGAKELMRPSEVGFRSTVKNKKETDEFHKEIKEKLNEDLKKHFKPEFLNRVDQVVVFRTLGKKEIKKIADIQIAELSERLKEKKISLKVTEAAKDFLILQGYDVDNGARPLRRAVENMIEVPLANGILSGEFKSGDTISILKKGESLQLYVLEASKK